jgi:thiamine phosphate synthase YjbQ (UPF0047 family)
MKSTFYRFKISEVIKTYKQKIRDEILKNEEEIDTTNKALYEKLLLEITTKDKYVSKTGVEYNKEIYINLNPLISDLIAKQGIENGFVICTSDHTTASVFISHFDKENITYLSKSLKKSYPYAPKTYKHNIWDHKYKNANGHLKSVFTGNGNVAACTAPLDVIAAAKSASLTKSCITPIHRGMLLLNPCDDIINAEFDYRPDKTFTIALFTEEENENKND